MARPTTPVGCSGILSKITTDSAGNVAATFRTSVIGRPRLAGGSAGFMGCVGRGP